MLLIMRVCTATLYTLQQVEEVDINNAIETTITTAAATASSITSLVLVLVGASLLMAAIVGCVKCAQRYWRRRCTRNVSLYICKHKGKLTTTHNNSHLQADIHTVHLHCSGYTTLLLQLGFLVLTMHEISVVHC
jgi:hypothetical protein